MRGFITPAVIGILTALSVFGSWYAYTHREPVTLGALSTFKSLQLAADPDNGECLTTDGSDNVWSSDCGSGPGGTLDGTGIAGLLASWTDSNTLTATATPTVAAIRATTSATSTFTGGIQARGFNATTFVTLMGETFTNFTTKVRSLFTGGTGIAVSSGDITFDCSEVEGTGINCVGEAITLDTTGLEQGLTAGDGLTRTANDFDCDTASGSTFGCLSSSDWTTFNNKVSGPGGSDTQIQFNNAGAFGGARLAYTEGGADSFVTHSGTGGLYILGTSTGELWLATAGYTDYVSVTPDFIEIYSTNGVAQLVGNSVAFYSGDGGYAFENGGAVGIQAILSAASIADSDKTFTFPNWSGNVLVASSTSLSVRSNGIISASSTIHAQTPASGAAIRIFENTGGEHASLSVDSTGNLVFTTSAAGDYIAVQSRDLINDTVTRAFQLEGSAAGSQSLPTYTFNGDSNTGMYSDVADELSFTAGGADFLRFLNSTSDVATALLEWDFGGATSLEIPNGTGPTVDAAGEFAFDTTDNQFVIATGTTARAIPTITKLWGRTVASTSVDFISGGRQPLTPHRDGVVITEIHCYVDGGTSKVINLDTLAGGANTDSLTCGTTLTSDTALPANTNLSAGALMAVEFGATTGTVDYVTFSVWGYVKPE